MEIKAPVDPQALVVQLDQSAVQGQRVTKGHQDPIQVLQAHQDYQDHQDNLDFLDQMETRDFQDLVDNLVHLEQQDQVDQWGNRVHQDFQVLQEPQGSRGHQDFLDLRDLLDYLVSFQMMSKFNLFAAHIIISYLIAEMKIFPISRSITPEGPTSFH